MEATLLCCEGTGSQTGEDAGETDEGAEGALGSRCSLGTPILIGWRIRRAPG